MKIKYTITTILLFASMSLFAQVYDVKDAFDFFHSNKLQKGEWKPVLTEDDVSGSPYLNEEFSEGTVYTTSKVQYNGLPLRYNVYNDQIQFKTNEDEIMAIAQPEIIDSILFNDLKIVYLPYSNAKKTMKGFFIVSEEGNASLYKKPVILFEHAEEPRPYDEAKPARFVEKPEIFYVRIGSEPAKIIESKKDLSLVFTNHQQEIEKFVKKNKVKPNKPESIKKLVQYYNSL